MPAYPFTSFIKIVSAVLIILPLLFSHASAQSVKDYKHLIREAETSREKVLQILDFAEQFKRSDPKLVNDALLEIKPLLSFLNDDFLYSRYWVYFAIVNQMRDQRDSTVYYLSLARKTIANYKDAVLQFNYHNAFGRLYHDQRQLDSAGYYFKICLDIAEKKGDKLYLAGAHNNLGLVYESKSQLKLAYDHYMQALTFFNEIKDDPHAAVTLNNLGLIMKNLGESDKAIDFFQQAIQINYKMQHAINLAMNYGNLGTVYQGMKNLPAALEAHQMSLELALKNQIIKEQARAYHNIGTVYQDQEMWENANRNYHNSLIICCNYGIDYGVMINHLALAKNYFKQNNLPKSQHHVDSAYLMAQSTGDITIQVDALKVKSEIMRAEGKTNQALALLTQYIAMNDSLISITNKQYILDLQTRYETEKKEIENQSLKKENEAKSKTIRLQNLITILVSILLFLAILLVFIIIRSNKKVKSYSKSLEQLNQEMKLANSQLKELNETKDKLFSIIGHDLKSPFNSLLGFLNMLNENFDTLSNQEKKLLLHKLFEQTNNTYAMVENLLQWAMNQRGQITFHPMICNLSEYVESEINFLESRSRNKKIRLMNLVDKNILIHADANMLRIILRNLINNAIKFTDSGGTVEVSAHSNSNGISLMVKDNGRGMTQEVLHQLLSDHSYYSTAGTANEKGTGLGLKIVKGLLQNHNASLTIESEPMAGSIFTVFFPETNTPGQQ